MYMCKLERTFLVDRVRARLLGDARRGRGSAQSPELERHRLRVVRVRQRPARVQGREQLHAAHVDAAYTAAARRASAARRARASAVAAAVAAAAAASRGAARGASRGSPRCAAPCATSPARGRTASARRRWGRTGRPRARACRPRARRWRASSRPARDRARLPTARGPASRPAGRRASW